MPPTENAPVPELGIIMQAWNPAAQVPPATTHADPPIPADAVFPVAPPPALGLIRTAHTTFRTNEGSAPLMRRIFATVGGVMLALLFTFAFDGGTLVVLLAAAVIGGGIGFALSLPRHVCSYVGTNGVAFYKVNGQTQGASKSEEFLFEKATDLRVRQLRRYYGLFYIGTTYIYEWKDDRGARVFRRTGTFQNAKGLPGPKDAAFHFVRSAEAAWTGFQDALACERLSRGETVVFPLNKKDRIEVTPDTVSVIRGSKMETIARSEIGTVSVNQGQVVLSRQGGSLGFMGVGKSGVVQFPYANLGNARLLFTLLGRPVAADEIAGNLSMAPAVVVAQAASRANQQAKAVRQGNASKPDSEK